MDNKMLLELYHTVSKKVKHCVWLFSDLQQSNPVHARSCMDTAMEDLAYLGNPAEQIWYLGDSVEGSDLKKLEEMAKMQEQGFGQLHIPLYYVTGNHDYDYSAANLNQPPRMPFYELVQAKKEWHTTKNMNDTHFTAKLGDYTIFFLSDHIAQDNSWLVTHGKIRYGADKYPYTLETAVDIRNEIANTKGKVITASHYSFFGGNRESEMLSQILPLPENVRLHVYGHSHIGDLKCAGKDLYRRISWIDYHDIPQIDVASLENIRAEFCRSLLLHIYEDDSIGLFFRDHDHHKFTDAYFPAQENFKAQWKANNTNLR